MPKVPQAVLNQQIASDISKKITNFLTWREPLKQNWDRYYKLYRTKLDAQNYPWQANIFVPYAFSTVETIVPRLISSKPQIDVTPRESNDTAYAKVQALLIDYEWEKMEVEKLLPDMIRQFLVYGTSILKVYWEKIEEEVEEEIQVDPDFPELGKQSVTTTKAVVDQPKVELIDLYDFFWDPNGYNIETCSWVAHRSYRSFDYLKSKQKAGLYKNIDLLKNDAGKIFSAESDKSDRQSVIGISDPQGFGSGDKIENSIEIIEYWENGRVVTIANRKIVIREEKVNPFKHGKKPFIRLVDQSVPKEFCGIGEIEPIETLQYELNDMRNQRMDNATMILNRMWIVENKANVDEDELVSDVGGVIHTDDINGIQPVLMPEVPNSSYREETLIKADIQQTTGITDYTKGVASDALANETATGISLMQEAGNARLRLKMMNVEQAIKEIGEFLISLNKQFITDEMAVRIAGDEGFQWIDIKPEEIKDNFDVIVQPGSTLPDNDAIQRKQLMELFQVFAGDPDINQVELKKRVLEKFNIKNLDKLLSGPGSVPTDLTGNQTQLSEVPGGVAGLPGNSDRNASGVMQSANELTRKV